MKCKSCGAEIGLTVKKCPYCGRAVTETAGYRADLNAYSQKSERTKRKLAKVLAGNIPLVISAVVMVALFVAICIALYVKENAYHFRSDAMRSEAARNHGEYSAEIDKYLKAGDYTGFAAFKEYHNIAEWEEPYDDLRLLWEMTEEYNSLVSHVESSVVFGQDARRYRPEQDVSDCCREINEFYNDYDSRLTDIENDPYGTYIHDMKKKADIILRIYLGMDDPQREAYLAAPRIEQEAYLEEVIINE